MFEIGNSLREARLRRELEFPDAEHGTKIRGKYLRALEDERFELLPAHTYVKGFLRSYADYLGLDGQLYVDEYNSRYVIGEEDAPIRAPRRVPAAEARRAERRESSVVLLALAAIALVTALVIAAWRFGGPDEQPVRGLQTPTPAATVGAGADAAGTARARAARDARRLLPDRPLAQRDRQGPLPGHARARPAAALRRQGALGPARVARERAREAERQPRASSPAAVKAQGVFVTAKKIFAADASLTAQAARGRSSSSRAASSCAASEPT